MAQLPQYWYKCHDVEGVATDAGQPRGTTPKSFDIRCRLLPAPRIHFCVKYVKVKAIAEYYLFES